MARQKRTFYPLMISRNRLYPLIIAIVSLVVVLWCWRIIRTTDFVGYADPAAYGQVAHNIAAGRGPVQDFIDFFYQRTPTITHLTDHWYSLFTILLLPFFFGWGKSALAVKLPVLLAYLLLPLSVYFLGARLFNSHTGFLAALTTALHPYILEYSINGWPDIPATVLTVWVLLCYLKTREHRLWYLLLGFTLGLLCWFRASGFLIGAGLILDFMWHSRKELLRSCFLWLGIVTFILGYGPALYSNLHYFGVPFKSSHTNLSATMGYFGNPQEEHWQILWDNPPALAAKIRTEGFQTIFYKTG
ncbi:glycosyltransferase family 39 protein, partial [candidate division CSSED10-310 bacterium]